MIPKVKEILAFLIGYVLAVTLVLSIVAMFAGCATMPGGGEPMSRLSECKKLCQGNNVDFFKDETLECQCRTEDLD
jgi:hypothetical protein